MNSLGNLGDRLGRVEVERTFYAESLQPVGDQLHETLEVIGLLVYP